MAKMGRPKLDAPKNNRILVRFDDKDYQELKKYAEKINLTVAETIRKGVEDMLASQK